MKGRKRCGSICEMDVEDGREGDSWQEAIGLVLREEGEGEWWMGR